MTILSGFRKALKRTASLLPLMPKAHPMYRGNPAITILRLFLWLMPAVFVPVAIFLGTVLSNVLPVSACISLSLLLFVTATAGIGLFEQLLTFQEARTPPPFPKTELLRWTIIFVLVQIVLAPIILASALGIFGAVFGSFAYV
jgi:hypothetical protein